MQRTSIDEDGVVGVVCEPEAGSADFAVVLAGSGGGVPERHAARLAECGITAMALAYFGAPGLSRVLVEIPLEQVTKGIDLFRDRFAGNRPVGLLGSSKGAELALCLSSRVDCGVGPVVAVAPTCVAWYGLDPSNDAAGRRPSWTLEGRAVPFLAYRRGASAVLTPAGLRVDRCYEPRGYPPETVDVARIQVERVPGPVLLLSGDEDHMWPSCAMAEQLVQRMVHHGRGADIINVVYPGAGHTFLHYDFRDPAAAPVYRWDYGGDDDSDARACRDAWQRIVTFFGCTSRGNASRV